MPGFAFDFTCEGESGKAWDSDVVERREEARRRLRAQQPMFLIGSPMCTAFTTWQALNAAKRDPSTVHREWVRAMVHLRFVCELYQEQMDAGRYLLHEHPGAASSWGQECVAELLNQPEVEVATCDRCQHGREDGKSGEPAKKPTNWMSNSLCILESLTKRCEGRGGDAAGTKGGNMKYVPGGFADNHQCARLRCAARS